MFALTLHNTVIQYKNDLQKAAKINVTLRYPLEIIYVLYKTSQTEYEKNHLILFNSKLIDSLSC